MDATGANWDAADMRRAVTFPELEIPTGQTWEMNSAFGRWVSEVVMMCGNLSVPYGDVAMIAFSKAQERYQWQREHPTEIMPKAEPPEQIMRKYSARLVHLLMTAIPQATQATGAG